MAFGFIQVETIETMEEKSQAQRLKRVNDIPFDFDFSAARKSSTAEIHIHHPFGFVPETISSTAKRNERAMLGDLDV